MYEPVSQRKPYPLRVPTEPMVDVGAPTPFKTSTAQTVNPESVSPLFQPDKIGNFLMDSLVRFPVRSSLQAALTLSPPKIRENIGSILPSEDFGKIGTFALGEDALGEEPIEPLQTDVPIASSGLKEQGFGVFSTPIALLGTTGSIALDLLPFGSVVRRAAVKVAVALTEDAVLNILKKDVPKFFKEAEKNPNFFKVFITDLVKDQSPESVERKLREAEKMFKETLAKQIEPSVVQRVNDAGEKEFFTINKGELGTLTPDQMTGQGFKLMGPADARNIPQIPITPRTADEFLSLPEAQQKRVFDSLPQSVINDLYGDVADEVRQIGRSNPLLKAVDDIITGKRKLAVSKKSIGEYKRILGEKWRKYFNPSGTKLDNLAEEIKRQGIDIGRNEEILEAISSRVDELKRLRLAAKTENAQRKYLRSLEREIYTAITKKRYSLAQKARFVEQAKRVGQKIGAVEQRKTFRSRQSIIQAIEEQFNLDRKEVQNALRRFGVRDVNQLNQSEFNNFVTYFEEVAKKNFILQEARMYVKAAIFEKELQKADNLREAMKLPPIEQMTLEQAQLFAKTLDQFKVGDEFLTVRELETVKNTDLAGISTVREAKERLAKQMGVSVDDLNGVKFNELDKYRYDASLARRNPLYKLMVNEKDKAMFESNARFLERKNKVNSLISAARASRRKTLGDFVAPKDDSIFNWLEAVPEEKLRLARDMTKEELTAAEEIRRMFVEARDYLVQNGVLKKFRQDYVTHIRRPFFEAWRDDGLMSAFKEVFDKYKQDEAMFAILNEKTGEILPFEKFFQFALRRTGELKASKNVAASALAYFSAFDRKIALDSIIPKLDIYVNAFSPKMLTPRGLEMDTRLKSFFKQWMNTKKGRVADLGIVSPGGKVDWFLRTGVALTRILDLGLSIPIGLASSFGEQAADFLALGLKQYSKGARRLLTKRGREITSRYSNFVGEPLIERMKDASLSTGDKLSEGAFGLFSSATRRANQVYLLGAMTDDEFLRGAVSTSRLADMQANMARYRVVGGYESVMGKTSLGKVITQYKTWAVPLFTTTLDNITTLTKMLAKGDKAVLQSREFQELFRATILMSTLAIGTYGIIEEYKNKKGRSLLEDIIFKSARDSLSLIGAIDPTLWTGEPRLMSFITNIGTSIKQLLTLERFKESEKLKGPESFKKAFTPAIVRQATSVFSPTPSKKSTGSSGLPELPKLPSLPNLPSF